MYLVDCTMVVAAPRGTVPADIEGDNISECIWNSDPIAEMMGKGWLTKGTGN